MDRVRAFRFGGTRQVLFVGLLVIAVSAAAPVFGQASGTWIATGTFNSPRIGHTATLLANGKVLVAGGEDTSGHLIAAAELYNPATGTWTVTDSLAPRFDHTATLLVKGGGIGRRRSQGHLHCDGRTL